jgi:hypothetical protein
MLSVSTEPIMLSVIMLNVAMLSVVLPQIQKIINKVHTIKDIFYNNKHINFFTGGLSEI